LFAQFTGEFDDLMDAVLARALRFGGHVQAKFRKFVKAKESARLPGKEPRL
jgi:hypothetical protein